MGLHFENGARVTIARSTVRGSVEAYAYAPNTAKVSVSRSSIIGHPFAGLRAQGSGLATVTASDNAISNNNAGVTVYAGGRMVATGNTVSNNGLGFYSVDSGLIESAGDNTVRNNTTDVSGNPLAPISRM